MKFEIYKLQCTHISDGPKKMSTYVMRSISICRLWSVSVSSRLQGDSAFHYFSTLRLSDTTLATCPSQRLYSPTFTNNFKSYAFSCKIPLYVSYNWNPNFFFLVLFLLFYLSCVCMSIYMWYTHESWVMSHTYV